MPVSHALFRFIPLVAVLIGATTAIAEPDPNFHCYLLFGQSNMAGGAAGQYDGEGTDGVDDYCDTTPRVKVLAFGDCNRTPYPCPHLTLNRTHDEWYTAFPPYHNCHEGLGPADGFGKTLLDSIHEDISIGFIPCALSGEAIEVFQKGSGRTIADHTRPSKGTPYEVSSDAYGWMVKRCKIAQETGVIKGILLHQGESNCGDGSWPGKVKSIIDNLKADLGLWDSIPLIAGELRYDGSCPQHNPIVNQLPGIIPNCAVASAEGIERRLSRPDGQTDIYHFSTAGTKEFGFRYAEAFLGLVDQEYMPRVGTTANAGGSKRCVKPVLRWDRPVTVYSLDGRVVATVKNSADLDGLGALPSGRLYIASRNGAAKTGVTVPFVVK